METDLSRNIDYLLLAKFDNEEGVVMQSYYPHTFDLSFLDTFINNLIPISADK